MESMKCGVCGKDIGDIIMLLSIKTEGGHLDTWACLKCAENSSAYCKIHERPHLGFFDGTTACMSCINEMVLEKQLRYSNIFIRLEEHLSYEEFERLAEWAATVSSMVKDSQLNCILRALVTKAQRSNQSVEEVFDKIVEDKSVKSILPLEVFP